MPSEVEKALYEGDIERLQDIARCICCCSEHTFGIGCPAFAWGGCRGGYVDMREEREAWAAHYLKVHGMTLETFYNIR